MFQYYIDRASISIYIVSMLKRFWCFFVFFIRKKKQRQLLPDKASQHPGDN